MNLQEKFRENEIAMINAIENGIIDREELTWFEIANIFLIKPEGTKEQKRKAANDIWRKYIKLQDGDSFSFEESIPAILEEKNLYLTSPHVSKAKKIKRLFYDIETSYNVVKAWRAGYNLTITPEDIIHERAIITIAYKWEGDDTVTVLTWDNGDDSKVITEFIKVMGESDEMIGHNIDHFDTKFIMGRALKHGIIGLPKYQSTDTLKLARKHFLLNSNKLDYIAQLLGIGSKIRHRGMAMWDDIILRNDLKALEEMVQYNVQDVRLTEEVYKRLIKYTQPTIHHGVINGGETHSCPECGKMEASLEKTYVSKVGTQTRLMKCTCGTHFTITNKKYQDNYEGK